jgi:hypothetical protein
MAIKVANNQSLTAITSIPASITGGAMTLLETQTASSDATISFTSDIDSTYDEYVFKFYDIHPSIDAAQFSVGFRDGSTAYDATKTSTTWRASHYEGDGSPSIAYRGDMDQAQATGFQIISDEVSNDNDHALSGTLQIFAPSNTTFVKHFMARSATANYGDTAVDFYTAGYCNVTAAIDAIQFKFLAGTGGGSAGNIDSGVIKLYGIS